MSKPYSNILFDLDGTLTDSAEGVINSIKYALSQYGIEGTPEEFKKLIGPPLQHSFQKIYGFNEEEAQKVVEHYRDYFREKGILENRLYPGIPGLLAALKGQNCRIYLATSKPTVFAEKVLSNFEISSFFNEIVVSNLDGSRVLKAEVIGEVIRLAGGMAPTETVMVGDRREDIAGAKAHQFHSIAVSYGYATLEELEAAKPDAIAGTVAELQELLIR